MRKLVLFWVGLATTTYGQGPKTATLDVLGWSQVATPVKTALGIVVHPDSESFLYLSTQDGLYVSSDSGNTWARKISTFMTSENVVVDPTSTNRVYAASVKTLYVSEDRGVNWTPAAPLGANIVSVAVSSKDGTVYLGLGQTNDAVGVLKSTDKGKTWKGSPFPTKDKNLIVWDVERDPVSGYLFAGFEIADHPQPYKPMYLRSKDDGQSWEDISGTLRWHVVKTQIDPASGTVYAMAEGPGLYRSTSLGDGIRYFNPNPGLTLFLHPGNPKWLFGGNLAPTATYQTEDVGGVYYSVDGGLTRMNNAGLKGLSIGGMATNKAGNVFYAVSYGTGLFRGSLQTPKLSPATVTAAGGDPVLLPCGGCLLPTGPITLQIAGRNVAVSSSADSLSFEVPADLAQGTYNAALNVGGAPVPFQLSVPSVAPPVIRAMTSAAFVNAPVFAQGELVSLFGLRLSGLPRPTVGGEAVANRTPWGTTLNGTKVFVDGVEAKLQFSYTSSIDGLAQVNFQLPESMVWGTHQVYVKRLRADGTSDDSNVWPFEGRRYDPTLLGNTAYPVFAQNITRDPGGGNFVSAEQPMRPGDVITLYATGFGLTTPVVPAGSAASQLSKVVALNRVYLDPNPLLDPNTYTPTYPTDSFGGAVASPQFPGLYQLSFRVPYEMGGLVQSKLVYLTLFLAGFRSYPMPFSAK